MSLTYIGPSAAVCERCLTRCDNWYEDMEDGGRLRIIRCPICSNGDPLLDTFDYDDPKSPIDSETRFLLYIMHRE